MFAYASNRDGATWQLVQPGTVRVCIGVALLLVQGALRGQAQEESKTQLTSTQLTSTQLTSSQMSERVDQLLNERMTEMGWQAAGQATDVAIMRRVYLDLTGLPPTGSEVLAFLAEERSDKRARLIDRLLASPTSATHLGSQWADWMLPEDNNPLIQNGRAGLQNWLRDRFAENLRYDRLVADLLVSTGPAESGPTAFFVALEGRPEKIAAKTARVFLGVQLDCAECHDHPFDEWTQDEFWGFAAYFAQLSTNAEAAMMGRGEVADTGEGEVTLPGTEDVISPAPLVETGFSGLASGTRRQQLTLWLTARENPFLARASVNRVWALLFGQGLIEPIDDMRSLEMASHPQLLGELSDYFAGTGYDLRDLIKTLANTQAYGRSTQHVSGEAPALSYAVMTTKPLTERQMTNSLSVVARQIAGEQNQAAQVALATQLGKLRGDASQAKLGIVSALVTLHGDFFDQVSSEDSSRLLKALEAPFMDQHKQLRWLFLSTLNRMPTTDESQAFSELLSQAAQRDDSEEGDSISKSWQSDMLWALLNSTEFAMTP